MFPIFAGNSASTGYNLTRSLRFRASASSYLNRTFTTPTNNKIWTYSFWAKRGQLGAFQQVLASRPTSTPYSLMYFGDTDNFQFDDSGSLYFATSQLFRDVASWYHIVVAVDTTQATSTNRFKLYVNGVQVTAFSSTTYPAQNYNTQLNTASSHAIGKGGVFTTNYLDGYLTEINFIDGQALTPSSFGSTNALTGVWQPARYTGTYGTNGFYLPFTDNSALTTSSNVGLGKDFSGNGNYWTTNNISITAGVTYDSMTDVPTLTSATAANFAVLNPLKNAGTVTNANLTYAATAVAVQNVFVSMALPSTTKIYFETTFTTGTVAGVYAAVGIATQDISLSTAMGTVTNSWAIESNQATDSINRVQGAATSYGGGTYFGNNDVCMIAVDQASGKIWYGKNGTWFSSGDPAAGTNAAATTVSTTATLFPVSTIYGTSPVLAFNFGQRPFVYTPPTGFVALNTYNLPTSTIVKGNTVMDATLYTGNGTNQTITNAAAFKPDLVWVKCRSLGYSNYLEDSVRGVGKDLSSNSTGAEATFNLLTSFNSNGFTVSTSSGTYLASNDSGQTFVGWQWQAGQGTTSSNTNGTITSTVSVNASAGFSVVTYTGTGANATVGHGLGVAPAFYVVKARNYGSGGNWVAWHTSIGQPNALWMNLTNAQFSYPTAFNSTNPTSSVLSLGTAAEVNNSGSNFVAYCWTPIAGFSAFGSYLGNGSTDGPFVYLGFRPKFVLIKMTSSTGDWYLYDSSRDPYNTTQQGLSPNSSASETTYTGWGDLLSNGFKIRRTDAAWNSSGGTYIYACFSENPFRNALAR